MKKITLLLSLCSAFSLLSMERPEPVLNQPAEPQSAVASQNPPAEQTEAIQRPAVLPDNSHENPPLEWSEQGQKPGQNPQEPAGSVDLSDRYEREKREFEMQHQKHEEQIKAEFKELRERQLAAKTDEERMKLLDHELKRSLQEGDLKNHETVNGGIWLKEREEQRNREAMLEQVRIKAEVQSRGLAERAQIWANALRDPKVAGVLGLTAILVFAGWHGTKLVGDSLGHYLQIPPLAQKTSIKTMSQKITQYFYAPAYEKNKLADVILEPQLATRVYSLTASIKNTASNDGFFRHYLLYGPPGTGKTMLALGMAEESGLEHIFFAASKLEQYSIEEGTKQLAHLFEYAKNYPKKCMIIMDEAEVLFGKRELMSDKTHKLLSVLLAYTGTESKHFMLMALTNKPSAFDAAALSRLGEKIKIDAPAFAERSRLLEQYLEKHIKSAARPLEDKRSWLTLRDVPERKLLIIEEGALDKSVIDDIVQKLDNFVGRDIADLCIAIRGAAFATSNRTLTKEMIYQELESKLAQKQAELGGFEEVGPEKE